MIAAFPYMISTHAKVQNAAPPTVTNALSSTSINKYLKISHCRPPRRASTRCRTAPAWMLKSFAILSSAL